MPNVANPARPVMDDLTPSAHIMQSAPGAETVVDGRRYLYFAGTSYLGLAGHPEVIEAACKAVRLYGVHTATSRAGFGNNPPTLEVEQRAAEFFGTDAAFYFASGYAGNHVLVQALAERADVVFVDAAAHFCVEEAAKLAGKPITRFRHCDAADLEQRLREQLRAGQRPFIMSDGVFATTGTIAPLPEYVRVLSSYDTATLVIDDAHGIVVLGEHGRGTLEHHGLWQSGVNASADRAGLGLFLCGTLAKAMGGFGGIVPGSREFIQRARTASHYFDGASAPPSPAAGATAKAIEIVMREPGLRQRLRENIRRLRAGLRALGVAVEDCPTANLGVQLGGAANMRRVHTELKAAGILVPYVAAYSGTGPEGLLRFAVCAAHTPEMIDRLLAELRKVL